MHKFLRLDEEQLWLAIESVCFQRASPGPLASTEHPGFRRLPSDSRCLAKCDSSKLLGAGP